MIFIIVNILFPTFQVARWTNESVLSCESLGNDANSKFVSSVAGDVEGNITANLTIKFRLQNIKCDVFSTFSCYSVNLFLHFHVFFAASPEHPHQVRNLLVILQEQSC